MERQGTRCAVCVLCGKCFEAPKVEKPAPNGIWSGQRCAVCISCGKCATAWGLTAAEDVDAVSHATDMASMAKRLDTGQAAPPPIPHAPGIVIEADDGACDAVSGATPGVSAACKELGLADMGTVIAARHIKPPGVA